MASLEELEASWQGTISGLRGRAKVLDDDLNELAKDVSTGVAEARDNQILQAVAQLSEAVAGLAAQLALLKADVATIQKHLSEEE